MHVMVFWRIIFVAIFMYVHDSTHYKQIAYLELIPCFSNACINSRRLNAYLLGKIG